MATPVVTENDVSLETHTEREVGCTRHHNLILGFNAFVQAVAKPKRLLVKEVPPAHKKIGHLKMDKDGEMLYKKVL